MAENGKNEQNSFMTPISMVVPAFVTTYNIYIEKLMARCAKMNQCKQFLAKKRKTE